MNPKNITNCKNLSSVTPLAIRRRVWVTFEQVGFHCYPDAPDEVAYLRDRHRHVFKFKVTIDVEHNERDIEFHMLKNFLLANYLVPECQGKSCETMAEEVAALVHRKYPLRQVEVEVSEDGECGAVVNLQVASFR